MCLVLREDKPHMFHTTHKCHERREGAHVRDDKITPTPEEEKRETTR
jgi:hypothetical protein